jgi:poly-gamma-glutamate synthase PgsB/CapB
VPGAKRDCCKMNTKEDCNSLFSVFIWKGFTVLMRYWLIMISTLAVYLGYLIIEWISLIKIHNHIPNRICVTGTRGKSGVVRMIAAILRESGCQTLAKVTGSKPVVILPDGREEEIRRFGPANILEQVKIMRRAERLGADAVVVEIMSIHPENHYVESCRIIRPQIVAVTNIRLDHTGQMGASKAEIAATIGLTISESATVITNETDYADFFRRIAADRHAAAMAAPGLSEAELWLAEPSGGIEFRENVELAVAVAARLGIPKERALAAISKVKPDFGALRVWKLPDSVPPRNSLAISAFAANDPESTRKALDRLGEKIGTGYREADIIGLLNLRSDRPERTAQWRDALLDSDFFNIGTIICIGDRPACLYLQSKLRANPRVEINVVSGKKPEKIMEAVAGRGTGDVIVVGFGNIKGAGEMLVNYWDSRGKEIL